VELNTIPKQRLTVSLVNLLLVVTTGLLLVLLWQLRSLLVTLMIAVVIAAALAPIIDRAQKLQIPRLLAVIVVYLGLLGILTGVGLLIGPPWVAGAAVLLENLYLKPKLLAEQQEEASHPIRPSKPQTHCQ
jgi:predicted PurR-regulated permease PerM